MTLFPAVFSIVLALLSTAFSPPSLPAQSLAQITQTSGSNLELKGGGLSFSVQSNREVALSDDASVLAFTSDGNHDLANPNLQTQIWAFDGTSIERITSIASGTAQQPALTSNGRWITFAASGDLTGGNSDGNLEIFRYNRLLNEMLQVTDTTDCENTQPSISHNNQGRRIAFLTDCSDLVAGFNSDENREFVLWSDDGSFRWTETLGCETRLPRIARHNPGRYVTLISDCDFTGDNGDGNLEVFQYNRNGSGSFEQVTDTSGSAVHDVVSTSWDGRWVAFLSNADHDGQNGDASLEIFRWNRNNGSFDQLTDAPATTVYLAAKIDDSGDYVAFERFDLLLGVSEVGWIDADTGIATVVASGDVALPVVAVESGSPVVAFQSTEDFSGTNADGNLEIWTDASGLTPPNPNAPCSTPGLFLPDSGSESDQFSVSSASVIADLDVYIDMTHTYVGDLVFTLEHLETGTSVVLIDRPGTAGGGFGCSGDDLLAVLDDDALDAVEDECAASTPTIAGNFSPNNPLAAFIGESYDGTWRLSIDDLAGIDTGTLVEWCLFFEPVP